MEIRTQSGQVMYEAEFRAYTLANGGPTWDATTSDVLAELGATVVLEGAQASPTRYQIAYRDGVEQIDGNWYTKYSVADMDDEAKTAKDAEQAKSIRTTRTEKLKDSDWTQIADSTADKAAWATYRQALRDITSQSGFPWEVTWPDAP
jgi:hypothetical protein